MKRLAVLALVVGIMALSPVASAGNKTGPCRDGRWNDRNRPALVHQANMRILECAVHKWPVSWSTAHYVAHRESGAYMWPWARNTSSGACGVFQHIPSYWAGRVMANVPAKWFGREHGWTTANMVRCTNARANILVTIHMAYKDGWGPWGM